MDALTLQKTRAEGPAEAPIRPRFPGLPHRQLGVPVRKEKRLIKVSQCCILSTGLRLVCWVVCVLAGVVALSATQTVHAVEGGFDTYFPGTSGNLGLAKFPGPGFYFVNFTIFSQGDTDVAARQGRVHTDISDTIVANAFVPAYISELEILGANFWAAAAIPVLYIESDATVEAGNITKPILDASNGGLGDLYLVPFGLDWKLEDLEIILFLGINTPVGEYDVNNDVNLGLNYWAFDPNVGVTWTLPENFELDLNLGYLFNLENTATDYKSGNAIHFDYTIGYNITKRFQVGLSGYTYYQVTGDSGSGATLGSFKGEGVGIGPSLTYLFGDPEGFWFFADLSWLHDVHTKNRIESDYVVLMVAFPLF